MYTWQHDEYSNYKLNCWWNDNIIAYNILFLTDCLVTGVGNNTLCGASSSACSGSLWLLWTRWNVTAFFLSINCFFFFPGYNNKCVTIKILFSASQIGAITECEKLKSSTNVRKIRSSWSRFEHFAQNHSFSTWGSYLVIGPNSHNGKTFTKRKIWSSWSRLNIAQNHSSGLSLVIIGPNSHEKLTKSAISSSWSLISVKYVAIFGPHSHEKLNKVNLESLRAVLKLLVSWPLGNHIWPLLAPIHKTEMTIDQV